MAFSEETLRRAWAWAGGRCECKQESHDHTERCGRELIWERRGARGSGGWEARLRVPPLFGATALENCEIVCWPCYQAAELRAAAE